jgi:multidrug efflux pump subunit AcrA (membrane-fusion protein)
MSRKQVFILVGILILAIFFFFTKRNKHSGEEVITCSVLQGPIEVKIHTSGQLKSENSSNIVLPEVLNSQNIRVYEIKITDLVQEGTVVDSGQYIATLDHKVIEEVLTAARLDLETANSVIEDAKLDTNVYLSNYRDLIVNSHADVEEQKIVLAESVYESPSVIKKAQMDLTKVERKLEGNIKGLEMRIRQLSSQMERRNIDQRLKKKRVDDLLKLYDALTIKAPKSGMVLYAKDRYGVKVQVGSVLTPWNAVITTLPDMTKLISETFVNEIDIAKIKIGQKVTLSIDAFPEKELTGEVMSVANIGQPMPRSDSKVFEVSIRVFGSDRDLKPAMTTGNMIQTGSYDNKLYIPSEAVFETDSTKFVYLQKNKIIKQIVDLGDDNDNYTIVNKGLEKGQTILLVEPEKIDDIQTIGWEIYKEQLEKQKQIKERENLPTEITRADSLKNGNKI